VHFRTLSERNGTLSESSGRGVGLVTIFVIIFTKVPILQHGYYKKCLDEKKSFFGDCFGCMGVEAMASMD